MRIVRSPRAAVLASCGTFTLVVLVAASNSYPLSVRLAPGGAALLPFRWASRILGLNAFSHYVQGELAVITLGLAGTGFLFAMREAWHGRISLATVLKLGLVFHAVVVLLPLLISEDVYQYAMYGRIAGIHHANPFVSPPQLFPSDAFFHLTNVGWRSQPAPYGPGFILLARLITSLANRPATVVLVFKVISGASSVATMLLVADFARRRWPSRAAFATGLIALNPAVLFVVVGSGHNDALIALLVAIAIRLQVRSMEEHRPRRELVATACLTLATLIKPPLLLLLVGFVALRVLRATPADRLGRLAGHSAVSVGTSLPLVLPFLGPHNPFRGVAVNYTQAYFLSPSAFITSALNHLHLLDVHLLAVFLTWLFRGAFLVVLVAAFVMIVRLAARDQSWQGEGAAYGWILLISILTGPQVRPWYFVWILPVAWLVPFLPRLTILACSAVLPLFVSVDPAFFPDLYDALVYTGLSLVASALLLALWLLVKDLILRTKRDASLWDDLDAPATRAVELAPAHAGPYRRV